MVAESTRSRCPATLWPGIAVPLRHQIAVAVAYAALTAGPVAGVAMGQRVADSLPHPRVAQHEAIVGASDLALAGGLLLGAAAISPFDQHIALWGQRAGLQNNTALHHIASTFNTAGGAGLVVVPVAAWAIGRIAHEPRVAVTAVRTGEAIALGVGMTEIVKGLVGRARPYAVGDTLPHDFHFGQGIGKERYSSFPSGHATAAWAAAGIFDAELKSYWPHAERFAGPAAYAGAAVVSLSRVYANKHWASDVLAGAAVGSLAARMVAHFHRDHLKNFMDRLFLSGGVAPSSAVALGAGVPVVAFAVAW